MMKGTIKWFSSEKGHGYLIGEDGQEYHIHIKEVKGTVLPSNGDLVEFEAGQNHRGLLAKNLVIVEKKFSNPARAYTTSSREFRDDRVECDSCNRKIVPRVITYKPFFHMGGDLPKKTICPYCGADYMHLPSNDCFIATAVYGDYDHSQVQVLRRYRDDHLRTQSFGRAFISVYYFCSPPIANWLRKHPTFAKPIRVILDKIVFFLNERKKL
jgi:cold shock CspA family protein